MSLLISWAMTPSGPPMRGRQLEAEVGEQLRHAGIVQNPRQ